VFGKYRGCRITTVSKRSLTFLLDNLNPTGDLREAILSTLEGREDLPSRRFDPLAPVDPSQADL
jgi:hypothetical protein